MRPDMVPGASFPDYELSDHRGQRRTLSALQGGDPLVLVVGGLVASGGEDRIVRVWRAADSTPVVALEGHKAGITSLAWAAGGTTLWSGPDSSGRTGAGGTIRSSPRT